MRSVHLRFRTTWYRKQEGLRQRLCARPEGPAAGYMSVCMCGRGGRTEGRLKPIDINTFEP